MATTSTSPTTAHQIKYPEHQRLKAISDQSQAIGGFIEWLRENGMEILRWQEDKYICNTCGEIPEKEARYNKWHAGLLAGYHHRNNARCDDDVEYVPEGHYPINKSIEQLLAEHFEIDLKKIDDEKRAMLDECRALNEQSRKEA